MVVILQIYLGAIENRVPPLSVCDNAPTPDQMGPVPIFAGVRASPLKAIETKYLVSTLPLMQTLSQTPNGNGAIGLNQVVECMKSCIYAQPFLYRFHFSFPIELNH